MEIKPTTEPGYEAKLVFSGIDVSVMSAMAKERVHKLAMNREIQQAAEVHIEMAGWAKRKVRRSLLVADLNEVAEWLTEFGDDTDAVVDELPEVTLAPAFMNEHVPNRIQLGRHALVLAAQINDEAVSRFAGGDFDEAVAGLLSEGFNDRE